MRKVLWIILLLLLGIGASAQSFNEVDVEGNITQRGNDNNKNRNFNPHNNDTTSKSKTVPKGITVWTVDRKFGDIRKAEVDTMPHLYPQSLLSTGRWWEFNSVGSNFTARQNRIFADRRVGSEFFFADAYDQILKTPDEWHFTNTFSPITNLSYNNCGDNTNGEDHLDARFAVNAGKQTGFGFDINYAYARGFFQNQNISHFGATVYASHLGDRYQLHALISTHTEKAAENGGITDDDYITHPELYTDSYSDNEIPTVLSQNWNRNKSNRLFLTHRYNVGFYRLVPMTPEELKAYREAKKAEEANRPPEGRPDDAEVAAGRPDDAPVAGDAPAALPSDSLLAAVTDSLGNSVDDGRIKVTSKEQADSLIAAQKKLEEDADTMKREFVPVTSFIHTVDVSQHRHVYQAYASPESYYANTYYNYSAGGGYAADSIRDETQQLDIRNTLAVALLEGFNRYAAAGLKVFATHELRRFDMPDFVAAAATDGTESVSDSVFQQRWTEHNISIGGQLSKQQGSTLHYNLQAEAWVVGEDAGQLKLDAETELNFPLLGDTMRLAARGYFYRLNPSFYLRNYHSKHLWWDNDLSKETRTRIEGTLNCERTKTRLRVAIEEIQNYVYIGMTNPTDAYNPYNEDLGDYVAPTSEEMFQAAVRQHGSNLNVLTAQLDQRLSLGPLHWDNIVTFQSSSNKSVLPLPTWNLFTNLYLEFKIAHVLRVELGAAGTWFSKYDAPHFCPQLNQYAVQESPKRIVELGNFPFVDLYANLHLKHARFFVMMNNAAAKRFDQMAFLAPHYPQNRSVMRMGVSWNFFN